MGDSLEDRMLEYEGSHNVRLMARLPMFARLDGRNFSAFTKHANKPFSSQFRAAMLDLTEFLVKETGARIGYSQSDEITLLWYDPEGRSEPMFNRRVQKLCSSLAAMASVKFNDRSLLFRDGLNWESLPTFDCRVWTTPNTTEAANVFVWRQQDASRNSVQMAARHYFSHKECFEKSTNEMQEMLHSRGVNWNDYAPDFKRGTFVLRREVTRGWTADEIAALPEKHEARRNPTAVFTRNVFAREDLWLTKIGNREAVLFEGAAPLSLDSDSSSK